MAHPSAARIIELYTRHAAAWDKERGRDLHERSWLTRFLNLMPPKPAVLDLGCGMGEPIGQHLIEAGARLTGVDASPPLLNLAQRRFPEHRWVAADMRGLSLSRRFDGILAWHSFFHLSQGDQRAMFPVFARHAQPGAVLLFTSGPAAGEAIGAWQGEELHHASLDPDDYRSLLEQSGFKVMDFVPNDPACGRSSVWLAKAG